MPYEVILAVLNDNVAHLDETVIPYEDFAALSVRVRAAFFQSVSLLNFSVRSLCSILHTTSGPVQLPAIANQPESQERRLSRRWIGVARHAVDACHRLRQWCEPNQLGDDSARSPSHLPNDSSAQTSLRRFRAARTPSGLVSDEQQFLRVIFPNPENRRFWWQHWGTSLSIPVDELVSALLGDICGETRNGHANLPDDERAGERRSILEAATVLVLHHVDTNGDGTIDAIELSCTLPGGILTAVEDTALDGWRVGLGGDGGTDDGIPPSVSCTLTKTPRRRLHHLQEDVEESRAQNQQSTHRPTAERKAAFAGGWREELDAEQLNGTQPVSCQHCRLLDARMTLLMRDNESLRRRVPRTTPDRGKRQTSANVSNHGDVEARDDASSPSLSSRHFTTMTTPHYEQVSILPMGAIEQSPAHHGRPSNRLGHSPTHAKSQGSPVSSEFVRGLAAAEAARYRVIDSAFSSRRGDRR